MKKLMALALALSLTVCLAGCGADRTLTAENQALTKQNRTLTAENKKLTAENKKLKTASGSAETSTGNVENDNPIDTAFQPKLDKAQTTYDISDEFSVTAGLRYTVDKTEGTNSQVIYTGFPRAAPGAPARAMPSAASSSFMNIVTTTPR